MCMSKPINSPPPPPPPQEIKQPESQALKDSARRNRSSAMTGGSLLTGPSGIANSALSTGKTSLLGQ
jgi:hypothetical protein